MKYLREIGKRVVLPIAIYKALSFCEPDMDCNAHERKPAIVWTAKNPTKAPYTEAERAERGYREINTIEELVGKLSPREKAVFERYEKRFASRKSREAETSYWVVSPYAKDYQEAAKDFGIPPELAVAHAAIENSNYKMILEESKRRKITPDRAYLSMESSAKAKGPFGIKELTAKHEGDLVVSRLKDERENPVEAARGAMKYLTSLMEDFGSAGLGYTAYWVGPTTLKKRGGSREYYLKILALGKIFENPHEYGISLQDRKKGSDFKPPWTKKHKKKIIKEKPRKNVPYQVAYRH